MKVPLLDLASQMRTVEADLRIAIDRVLASGEFILGSEVTAIEARIAALCGTAHAIGVSNGSDALVASLMAMGIGPGDEVIVPTFTFFATAGSVARVGARVVFVDILEDTFNMNSEALAAAITPRTRALIPVHLYGQCADMPRILAIAQRHKLAVIEDAAQAIGASFQGRVAGSFGLAGTLSFYPTKNLSAIGEAGMIVTNDATLAEKLKQLRNHGQSERYFHHHIGANFRLDGIQGAALGAKLKWLDEWNEQRRRHAARYDAGLRDAKVRTPPVLPSCTHVYHQYTIRCPKRDDLRTYLASAGIASGIYYPLPLHLQPCFADLGYKAGQFPVAERASNEVLSLPIYPEMSQDQQQHVIESICRFSSSFL